MKNYLFILHHAPHSGNALQEMLDIILTTAAFDQPVAVLLLDEAVFALKKGQQPEKHGGKDTAAIFQALPLYEVRVFVEAQSLHERGLTTADLTQPVQLLERAELAAWMAQSDVLFSD